MRSKQFLLCTALFGSLAAPLPALAQVRTEPFENQRIESVQVTIDNPSPDAALNSRVEDLVRRTLAAYPSSRFSEDRLIAALARLSRTPEIRATRHEVVNGSTGGVQLRVAVTLADGAAPQAEASPQFPTLYQSNGTLVRAKLETLAMYY
ncbi:hypothetical protein LNV09_04050, partial [Paucibacter sp. B2R-40]|uniref:hypothetical protein n=1 Tax=Paucibacter sp. B2R-40 TaxID=2893554 RepID=UPI0021E362CC